jgi:hypothetical protein
VFGSPTATIEVVGDTGNTSSEKAGVCVLGRIPDLGQESPLTSHFPEPSCDRRRVNLTHVPMRNDGILPAFACLKIVIFETVNMLASSSAVNARPIRSILSGSDIGSAVLFCGLHNCIYLLSGFTCDNCCILLGTVVRAPVIRAGAPCSGGALPFRPRVHVTNSLLTT